MAQAKTTKKTSSAVKKEVKTSSADETVSIDLQPFLTPLSILISGILIATSIFVSFKDVQIGTSRTGNNGTVATPTPGTDDLANGQTVVNIDDDPVLGNLDTAKVVIVEFSDFECPYCQRFHLETYDQIVDEYVNGGEVAYVFRDFPLSFHEPNASKAANAAQCINEQVGAEGYYAFSADYFANTVSNGAGLSGTTIAKLAGKISGVDVDKFNTCVKNEKFAEEINSDMADGQAAGVTGTPGFIIGVLDDDGNVDGVILPGAQPFSAFQQVIEEQLAR